MPCATVDCVVAVCSSVADSGHCVCVVELLREMSCPTCQQIVCQDTPDTELYALQRPLFPFVFFCPAGFDCSNTDGFKMVCCGELLSVTFPPGLSEENKAIARNLILNECEANLAICSGDNNPGCQAPPCEPPPPPIIIFYNREVSCNIVCPDGTTFVYTVPAGTFGDFSQADADAQAHLYACEQVALRRVCISGFTRCLCVGSAFSAAITATGGIGPIRFSVVSGALPDGLGMTVGGVISGTPTVPGVFHFSIKATTIDGGFNTKPFVLSVLEISTTSIPGYTVGSPYSYQMLGSGGSGLYNWSITTGTLPDGLTMNSSGLITGTPTGTVGTNPVEFKLIDTSCEAAVQVAQKPTITMAARSTTTISTIRGYDEFVRSFPPKRYKTATWSGYSEQSLVVNGVQIGGARYDYSGSDQINSGGFITNTHSKILSSQCTNPDNNIYGQILGHTILDDAFVYQFKGYYGMNVSSPGLIGNPTILCDSQSIPFSIVGDFGINGTYDRSDLWGSATLQGSDDIGISDFQVQDSLTKTSTDLGTTQVEVMPYCPRLGTNTDINIINPPGDFFLGGILTYTNSYSCALSDEYTDAEALANARVITGTSTVAQNLPRSTGFVSSFTNVVFTLVASNLVDGTDYLVSVDIWDQGTATSTTKQYGFTADNTGKHTITDVVPTPSVGHSLQVRNPRISFSP